MTNAKIIEFDQFNFQPMPKWFMVWDKIEKSFCGSLNNDKGIFDLIELSTFFMRHAENGRPHTDFKVIQSTNLFDEDGQEIFEGAIVRDYDGEVGMVYYDTEESGYWAKCFNGDSWRMDTPRLTKIIGHILSSPELLEEENV